MTAGRAVSRLAAIRWAAPSWPATMLGLMAIKPLADAVSPRTLEVGLDPGTVVASIPLLLLVPWALRRGRASLLAWLTWLGIVGLVAYTVAHAIVLSGTATLLEGVRAAAGLAPAVVLLDPRTRPQGLAAWRRLVPVVLLGLGVHVVAAWMQFAGVLGTTYTQSGRGRPSGLFHHPIQLGFLLLGAVLAVAVLHLQGKLSTARALALALVFSCTILISTHRTSLVVLVLILAAWALTALLRKAKVRRGNLGWGLAGVSALLLAAAFTYPWWQVSATRAWAGMVDVIQVADLDPSGDSFLRGRGQRWRTTLDQMETGGFPMLLVGYGYQIVDPHTDYLRLPLVHGILGSVLLLACLAWMALAVFRPAEGLGRIWLLVTFAAMAVFATTAKPTSYPSFMWAWTLVLFLSQRAPRQDRHLS